MPGDSGGGAGGLAGTLSGFLGAAGPWFQAGAFALQIFGASRSKEKARRAQYQQVEATERSETSPVLLAYGRSKVRAQVVIHRLSNEWHHADPDRTRGGSEFVVPGDNGNPGHLGKNRDMTFDTNNLRTISYAEFLLLQYQVADSGAGGIERFVDFDVDGVPWDDVSWKYGQRIHAYPQHGGATGDPLALANEVRRTSVFAECAYVTGAYRLNVNPFNEGAKGFYKRWPPLDAYIWGRRVRNVENGVVASTWEYSNNPALVLFDLLTTVGEYATELFDLDSVSSAVSVNDTLVSSLPGAPTFSPQRNGRIWNDPNGSRSAPWQIDRLGDGWTNVAPFPTDSSGDTPSDFLALYRDWLRLEMNRPPPDGFEALPTGTGIFAARGRYWQFDWANVRSVVASIVRVDASGGESFDIVEDTAPGRVIALSDISLAFGTGADSSELRDLDPTESVYVYPSATATDVPDAAARIGEFNGHFNPFTPLRDMVRQVLHVCPWTKMIWSSGKFKLPSMYPVTQAQEDALVAMTLTDDDLFEVEKQFAPADAAHNQAVLTFDDEEQDGIETVRRWPREGTAEHRELVDDEDGGRRSDLSLQLLGVSSPYNADILSEYLVRHSRSVPVYRVVASLKAYPLETGDLVAVDSDAFRTDDRMEVISTTMATFGAVTAVVFDAVHYDWRNNPAAEPPQNEASPPARTRLRSYAPSGLTATFDPDAWTIEMRWDDSSVARWSLEALTGEGDLSSDADFLARTDFAEIWTGRDNVAVLPADDANSTMRLCVRGISLGGVYTPPSEEVVVVHPERDARAPAAVSTIFEVDLESGEPGESGNARARTDGITLPLTVGPDPSLFGRSPTPEDDEALVATRADAEALRDAQATADPSWKAQYAADPGLWLWLTWADGSTPQHLVDGDWEDFAVATQGAASLDVDSAENVRSIELGLSDDDSAETLRLRRYLPQIEEGDVVSIFADRRRDWADYEVSSIPALTAASRSARFGVSFVARGREFSATGATNIGFSPAIDGVDGSLGREGRTGMGRWFESEFGPTGTPADGDFFVHAGAGTAYTSIGSTTEAVAATRIRVFAPDGSAVHEYLATVQVNDVAAIYLDANDWAEYTVATVADVDANGWIELTVAHRTSVIDSSIPSGTVSLGFSRPPRGAFGRPGAGTVIAYDSLGDATASGGYEFRGAATIGGRWSEVRDSATSIRMNVEDADGNSVASDLENVKVGEILTWLVGIRSWIAWQVESVSQVGTSAVEFGLAYWGSDARGNTGATTVGASQDVSIAISGVHLPITNTDFVVTP